MDLTDVTASVVLSQQYSRPGHSDIYHGPTRQRGCSFQGSCLNNHQNSPIDCWAKTKVFIPTEELLQNNDSLMSRKT